MTTSYVPTRLIPGNKIVKDWADREVVSLDDRGLYGRTTEQDRQEILNILNLARAEHNAKTDKVLREAAAEARVAHAYVWGILDTCKHLFSTAQFETMMRANWDFSNEIEYAAYMFHAEKSVGKYGYATAWQTFLKYNPQVQAILDGVIVRAR